jgi:anti-sigma-K factor RskA
VGWRAISALAAAVVLVVVLGVAVAASRGHATRPSPAKAKLPAVARFGDDADLMRRLERPKHVRGSR